MGIGEQSQEGRKSLLEFALLIDYFRSKVTSLRKPPAKRRGRKRAKNGARGCLYLVTYFDDSTHLSCILE